MVVDHGRARVDLGVTVATDGDRKFAPGAQIGLTACPSSCSPSPALTDCVGRKGDTARPGRRVRSDRSSSSASACSEGGSERVGGPGTAGAVDVAAAVARIAVARTAAADLERLPGPRRDDGCTCGLYQDARHAVDSASAHRWDGFRGWLCRCSCYLEHQRNKLSDLFQQLGVRRVRGLGVTR